jgi:hypothetical protein
MQMKLETYPTSSLLGDKSDWKRNDLWNVEVRLARLDISNSESNGLFNFYPLF